MAAVEKYFGGAGQKAGLEIWRIEKLEAVRYPKETYGSFYSGDSYIVLFTKELPKGGFEWHIHFWLGANSSQDEMGAAAILTVDLDDYLGGGPVQHREVQGHESKRFMSLFKSMGGVKYLEGGVESGFNHVDPDAYEPRFLHVKGKRNVRVKQVEMSYKSMNEGDVFVLDAGMILYQWNGRGANKYEKFKGLEMVNNIKDQERGGKPQLVFLDSGVNDKSAEADPFWKMLGGGAGQIADEKAGGDDDAVKQSPAELFCVSDASGSLEVTQVAKGVLERKMLDENDVFVLDSGTQVFVWVGKKATKQEKRSSMQFAVDYLKKNNRPNWCPVTRVVQNAETPVFKAFFKQWEKPRVLNFGGEKKERREQKVDTSALYAKRAAQEEKAMLDDGSGNMQIWRIENFEAVALDKKKYGQFHAGDSYIVLYEYVVKKKDFQILYFWQGRDSTQDEKSSAAMLTVKMDDELTAAGKDPTQVRVVMGKEPNHFLCLFRGKFIVHSGGVASGFKNVDAKDDFDEDGVSLYHVKATNKYNTRAFQVEERGRSLNSGDVFVLLNPKTMFVWNGVGANDQERQYGANIANLLKENRKVVSVDEGEEPNEFWDTLGGKEEYPSSKEMGDENIGDPRLFQCSNVTGDFVVEEIFNYNQDDLINEDVFILDAFSEVWVWVGGEANKREKKDAFQAAIDYVKNAPDGRSKDTPILQVNAGAEPPLFTTHFFGWDDSKAKANNPYLDKLKDLGGGNLVQKITSAADALGYRDPATEKFSYSDLKNKKVDKLDPKRREAYLSDDEFQKVFGMSQAKFNGLAKWKKTNLKKKYGLF